MFGLTGLGTLHTAIGMVAVIAGIVAFVRDKAIEPDTRLGQLYLWTTVVTCLTGFGIFQHGGFGKPHALGVLTLAVLVVATIASATPLFGRASRYIVTIGYTTTFMFHMIPGITETFTRVPLGAPLFSSPEDPALAKTIGVVSLFYLAGVVAQVLRLRAQRPAAIGQAGLA